MKKLLTILLTLSSFIGFSQSNSYPATGPMIADGLQFYHAGFGTSQLVMSAANVVHLIMPGTGGTALEVNSNTGAFDVQAYQLSSYQRGAVFGNTAGGDALTSTGNSRLAYNSGAYTLNGSGAANDGASQFINKGQLRTDVLYIPSGTAGQVLANDGANHYIPTTISSGLFGTWAPSVISSTNVNLSGLVFSGASYSQSGKIITLQVSGYIQTSALGVTTLFINLPPAFGSNPPIAFIPRSPCGVWPTSTSAITGWATIGTVAGQNCIQIQYPSTAITQQPFGFTMQWAQP